MTGPLNAALHKHGRVSKVGAGKPLHGREPLEQGVPIATHAQPDAAAACGTLRRDGVPGPVRLGNGLLNVRQQGAARDDGDARAAGNLPHTVLKAQVPRLGRRWPDPGHAGRLGEVRVLGQEAVAGDDCVCVGLARASNDLRCVKVRVGHALATEWEGGVC